MSCEMCGKFAGPDLIECEVDGVRMFLCRECAKFGTRISEKQSAKHSSQAETEVAFVRDRHDGQGSSVSRVSVKTGKSRQKPKRKYRRRDVLDSDLVLIDNYGEVIKEARKNKGYSLEDFAQLIHEKVSLLQKIEKSDFHPPDSLIIKIERKLDIDLREEAASPVYTNVSSKKETTLGDVVKLKKKKK
ncbi:MAG: multiprotein bridging factor aMBF1 [Asgard group archaeon]|nr:multiprotein bridging factor aMBF1 [Asgard group archaeon]